MYYRDADGDGYGNPADLVNDCSGPAGYVADNTDCDDSNDTVNPGATEICNDMDDNCSGTVDDVDASRLVTYYMDADADGYGNP